MCAPLYTCACIKERLCSANFIERGRIIITDRDLPHIAGYSVFLSFPILVDVVVVFEKRHQLKGLVIILYAL